MTWRNMVLCLHLITSTLWIGGLFMDIFIVWPCAKVVSGEKTVPLDFLCIQGKMTAPWLYLGIAGLCGSGALLLWLTPPAAGGYVWTLVGIKAAALAVMTGNVVYGTVVAWPALMFAPMEEAPQLWRRHVLRACVTFGCGLIALVVSIVGTR